MGTSDGNATHGGTKPSLSEQGEPQAYSRPPRRIFSMSQLSVNAGSPKEPFPDGSRPAALFPFFLLLPPGSSLTAAGKAGSPATMRIPFQVHRMPL
jgi:hypothetical protein